MLCNLLLVSRQLEQQDGKNSGEKAEMLRRLSGLQEENTRLSWDSANLAETLKRTQCELELEKQANRYEKDTILPSLLSFIQPGLPCLRFRPRTFALTQNQEQSCPT